LDIRLYGQTALVVGVWKAAGCNNGQPFDYAAHFLSIWIKEGNRWLNLASQSTEIQVD